MAKVELSTRSLSSCSRKRASRGATNAALVTLAPRFRGGNEERQVTRKESGYHVSWLYHWR